MKRLVFSVVIMCVIALCSCHTLRTYPIAMAEPTGELAEWNTLYPMARYDTSRVIKMNLLKGNTTIIYLSDITEIEIEGKYCEFRKNDMLYYFCEKWYSPGTGMAYGVYFVSNMDQSITYKMLYP